jgi:hypothetical protein
MMVAGFIQEFTVDKTGIKVVLSMEYPITDMDLGVNLISIKIDGLKYLNEINTYFKKQTMVAAKVNLLNYKTKFLTEFYHYKNIKTNETGYFTLYKHVNVNIANLVKGSIDKRIAYELVSKKEIDNWQLMSYSSTI